MTHEIALCLPKGENLRRVASVLKQVNFPVEGYNASNRSYRPDIGSIKNARAKIFAEKDVAIQVAVGNYSIGICGLDWIEEYRAKYPASDVQILKRLGRSLRKVHACCHRSFKGRSVHDFARLPGSVRIVSEYPNLAEDFAIRNGLKRFRVFPAWGSTEVYPPEHAEIVILSVRDEESLRSHDLRSLGLIMESELCIIVNQRAYETRDLSPVLDYLCRIERRR